MAPEASQLLTSQLRPCWNSQNQWNQNPTWRFFFLVEKFHAQSISPWLSSSICNLCLRATWIRVSPKPSTMRLQFSPVLVGDRSVSKACASLGDAEPSGTSQGSSSKQRFQRSTRVKKGHMPHECPLDCGSCSSLTQQTLSTHSITSFFHPRVGNSADDSTDRKRPQI